MPQDPHAVWGGCLTFIRERTTEKHFQTWFMPLRPVRVQEHELTLEVPTRMHYEWLESHYVDLLRRALRASALGEDARLKYQLRPSELPKPEPPPQEPANLTQQNGQNYRPARFAAPAPYGQQGSLSYTSRPEQRSFLTRPELPELPDGLCEKLTFERFVVGGCNAFAHSLAKRVAESPGLSSFNPLFIYGKVGMGKTHLIQAIGNDIKKNFPRKRIAYATVDAFGKQFIDALASKSIQSFMTTYMQLDVLLLDDVQFLTGMAKTQEILFNIINRLHQSGKQIILTADTAPKDIQGLQERLLTRFRWGTQASIEAPCNETRRKIFEQLLREADTTLPEDVLDLTVERAQSSIREMEGTLNSLIAAASFLRATGEELTLNWANTELDRLVGAAAEETCSIEKIQEVVCEVFEVTHEELVGKTRKKKIAKARQFAMYLCNQHTGHALKAIGISFGGKDHSTVVHAVKTFKEKPESFEEYQDLIEAAKQGLF